MTDVLTRDSSDTGDIPRIGEETREMAAYTELPPPRRPTAKTGELPLYRPVAIDGPQAPPPPLPPIPDGPVIPPKLRPPAPSTTGHLPIVIDVADRQAHGKPGRYRGRHRGEGRAQRSLPPWLRAAVDTVRGAW